MHASDDDKQSGGRLDLTLEIGFPLPTLQYTFNFLFLFFKGYIIVEYDLFFKIWLMVKSLIIMYRQTKRYFFHLHLKYQLALQTYKNLKGWETFFIFEK